jgi:hypothetical protein
MIDHDALVEMLTRLKLTAIRDQLDTLLDEAARREMTLREALGSCASARSPARTSAGSRWPARSPASPPRAT